MSLTAKEVKKIAKLSRIWLSDNEVEHFSNELSVIINWIEMLQEADTNNVPKMTSVSNTQLPLRTDTVTDGDIRDQILQNAPSSQYDCFVVPKVVE